MSLDIHMEEQSDLVGSPSPHLVAAIVSRVGEVGMEGLPLSLGANTPHPMGFIGLANDLS